MSYDGWCVAELVEAGRDNELFAVKEPWLSKALLHYHMATGSQRALDVLARAPDPHARYLLDALHEELHGISVKALPSLLARRPVWLHRAARHPLATALARAARKAHPPALLALAVLLTHAPQAAEPLICEAAAALLAALLPPGDPQREMAAHALFHAAYAPHPHAFLDAIRTQLHEREPATRARLEKALLPVLAAARLHPRLVISSCYSLEETPPPALTPRPLPPPVSLSHLAPPDSAPPRPGKEYWFSLHERSGAEAAPRTPLPAEAPLEGSPPEAAVEATPENTPHKETRAVFTFPAESTAVRSLGRISQPPSPARRDNEPSGRLARVVRDRQNARTPDADDKRDAGADVPEAGADHAWAEEAWAWARLPRGPPLSRQRPVARSIAAARVRRSASCPPADPCRSRETASQTLDPTPDSFNFIIEDLFKALPSVDNKQQDSEEVPIPCAMLDEYLQKLYKGENKACTQSEMAEQLALTHAQLMFERWRRETHAERSRRLLGRCRKARAHELQNSELKERVRALAKERDEAISGLRAAAERDKRRMEDERSQRLEEALAEEKAMRIKAEAALAQADERAVRDADALGRLKAECVDAVRRADSNAKAQESANVRAAHIKRLRRELLLLGEREARLAEAASGRHAVGGDKLRAAQRDAAAARAEAEAHAVRAEAMAARAHELDAALVERDIALEDAKRLARDAANEHSARLDALQDKYRALMHVLRRMEARRMEWAGGAPRANAAATASAHSSPLSASLASSESVPPALSECSRVRHLVDDDFDEKQDHV